MSKVLLIGYNPPQFEPNSKIEAAHYRTWQFLDPLLADEHEVCLCANIPSQGTGSVEVPEEYAKRITYRPVALRRKWGWVRQLQSIHDDFQPDCIVAVNFDCCLAATKLQTDQPIWMDIYGDYLTIMQVARYRVGSDRGITTSIGFVRQVLQRGDIFSVCSTPQAHACVGELAMVGRLNSRTFGFDFVRVVLPGASPEKIVLTDAQTGERTFLIERGIPPEAFVVLWCGGYNTWTDVDILFAGLEQAMKHNSQIHYLSVGANTYEAPDNVYTQFLQKIEQSAYKDRFHMMGWRPWTEVSSFYRDSDVGLNIDSMHYETVYGTRTRLVEMLAAGLPVVTSLGCELAELIDEAGAGLTFKSGDWRSMGQQILKLADDKSRFEAMAQQASNYARNTLSFQNTTASVRAWVKSPKVALDRVAVDFKTRLQGAEFQARAIVRQMIWNTFGLD